MRRKNKFEKKKTIVWICLLFALSLSIGYAILTEKLELNGSVNYGAMAFDVGFTTATDGGGTIASSPIVSSDKKTVTVSCNVGTSTSSETCIAKATIKNASSFAVELESDPTITFDNTYINSVTAVWSDTNNTVIEYDTLDKNTEKEIKITITTNQLTEELLPETEINIPITITMNWVEVSGEREISFANKKALFLGDSVAYGYSTNGNGFGYYINEQEAFLSYTNAAVNSATLNTTTQGTNNVIEQIKLNKNNDYDFVIIEGGYGDLRDTPPLGTITEGHAPESLDTTTFAGAIEYTLYLAKITWPNARIGFIVSYDVPKSNSGVRPDHAATKEYWDIAKAACDKWKIPYLDFFEGSTTYNGEVKTYSELFDVTGKTYIADGVHPSAAGYEFITPFIKDWMKTLPINEYVISDGIYTIVRNFTNLSFTSGLSLKSAENMEWGDSIGRASAVNYLVAVEGGSNIGLSSSANNVAYAIKEYDETKTYNSFGEAHSRWISEDITLHPSTKYIVVTFKNGDGSSNFTEEQLSLLPTYLEFKDPDLSGYTIVNNFNELEITNNAAPTRLGNGYTMTPYWGENSNAIGRATAMNYLIKVNGGETIGLTASASNISYAIGEVNKNGTTINPTMTTGKGQYHGEWLSENVTLKNDTRYIMVSFRNGDGSTSFTDEQLLLLPTYLEFK